MSINIKDTLQGYARIEGLTLTELNEKVNKIKKEIGEKEVSQPSFSRKIVNNTMQVKEFEVYLKAIGYKIEIVKDNK